MLSRTETLALLQFYVALGLDEATEAAPIDRRRLDPPPAVTPPIAAAKAAEKRDPAPNSTPRPPLPDAGDRPVPRSYDPVQAVEAAERIAAGCDSIAALESALREFDGCVLKATATNTIFADGDPDAAVMYLGQAPGAEEDREGKPFAGPSGELLDKMLRAIGLSREMIYVSNVVYWRPPGNRTPTPVEVAVCLPFVRRHLELKRPRLVVLGGATAGQAVLGNMLSIGRLRNRWHEIVIGGQTIPAIATYHPSFLINTPEQKREAWKDFLRLRMKLKELSILT